MHLSIIPLADSGRVRIERANDRSSYSVTRYDSDSAVIAAGVIAYLPNERPEDTKARAIGHLAALNVWPALQRAVKAERRIMDAKAGTIRAAAPVPRDELSAAVERITARVERENGLILP